jgi:lipopolysaccharide transport system permease protein
LGAGVLSFVFGSVAKIPGPAGIPYYLFSLTGMVGWTVFSQVLGRASAVLVGNAQLVSKAYFPRLLLPLSAVVSTAIDIGVSLALLAVVMALYGRVPGLTLLVLPIWLLLLTMLALGIGTGAGALMVRYRDVQYGLPVVIQFLLYASPVAYMLSAIPRHARGLFEINPLSGLLEGVRWSVLGTQAPSANLVLYATVSSVLLLIIGTAAFSSMERYFADVI